VYARLVLISVEALTIRVVVVQILVVILIVRVVEDQTQILVSVWAMFRAVATIQIRVVAKIQLILVV
jgi:hypothetical protein